MGQIMDKSPLHWPIILHSILAISSLSVIFYLILPDLLQLIETASVWLVWAIFSLWFTGYISIGPLFRNKEIIKVAGKMDVIIGVVILIILFINSTINELLAWSGLFFFSMGIFLIALGIVLVHSQKGKVLPEIADGPVKTTWWPWGPDEL